MSRADATKARILEAATAEFAEHGIAGARVDRIAASAKANKNLIYIYFQNKDSLFDAVFDQHIRHGLDEVPFTPEDLPGYAGRLFDYFAQHPEVLRLAVWHRMERGGMERDSGDGGDSRVATSSHRSKLDALAAAQNRGGVGTAFSPGALLTLVLAIASAWGPGAIAAASSGRDDPDDRRDAVVAAVTRLL